MPTIPCLLGMRRLAWLTRRMLRRRGGPKGCCFWGIQTLARIFFGGGAGAGGECIGLDAEFYEGAEVLLFPPEWLNLAENRADAIEKMQRQAKAIGIDPAEGGDQTAIAVVDELGLIELSSRQTPDTSVITGG